MTVPQASEKMQKEPACRKVKAENFLNIQKSLVCSRRLAFLQNQLAGLSNNKVFEVYDLLSPLKRGYKP
jgi:hypothetical protein